jgi:hypothetical protein
MAQLSADKVRIYQATADSDFNDLDVAATTTIYKGSAVGLTSGYCRQLVAADVFVGFAEEKVDNSAGSAGDKKVSLRRRGFVNGTIGSIAVTDIGSAVSMSDGDTFTLTTLSNSSIGYVHALDPEVSDGVVIRFDADYAHSSA